MYPWPSFIGFKFESTESPIWGTDAGWVLSPSYSRQRPLGSSGDVITALAIGSAERTFEVYLTPARFLILQGLLNTTGSFTDWTRPLPESRNAFLTEVVAQENVISLRYAATPGDTSPSNQRKIRTKLTFVSVS